MTSRYVAVDVGGTKILAAVVSGDGQILVRQKHKTDRGSKKRLLAQIEEAISGVIKAAETEASVTPRNWARVSTRLILTAVEVARSSVGMDV